MGPPRQCPGPNPVCELHKRPARCSYKYSENLFRLHQIVPQCEISRGCRENTARPGQPHEMVPLVAVRFQRSNVQGNSFRNRQHKTPVHYERHPIGSNTRREGFGCGDRRGVKVSSTCVTGSEEGISNARFSPCNFHLPGRDNNSKVVHHHAWLVRPHLEYGNVIWHPR